MELLYALWWLIPTTFMTAILTGTTGAGGGVLLLGVMGLALPPAAVVPVHGAAMMWQNGFRALMLVQFIEWRALISIIIGSVIGALLAVPIAMQLNPTYMQMVLGFGLLYLVWLPRPHHDIFHWLPKGSKTILLAGMTSVVTMLIGAAGVLFAAIRRRTGRTKEAVLAEQSAVMLVQHALKVLLFGGAGFVFYPYVPLVLAQAVAGMLGTWVGVYLLKKVSNHWFDDIFKLVVSIMAGLLLVRAFGF